MNDRSTAHDYVVVGGGSASCVLAARLAEHSDASVLLLEAGDDERRPDVETPEAWPSLLFGELDWGYSAIESPITGRSIPAHRGKVLGGSGSINVMAHLRGCRADYAAWESAAGPEWSWDALLPYFKRSESVPGGDAANRGTGGPLRPQPIEKPHPLSRAHVEAARLRGHALAEDLNDGEMLGAALHDLLIEDGKRQSAATAYLRPALERGARIELVTGVHARRLRFAGTRCTGVEYTVGGETRVAEARAEVILAAGTVGSTQLLILSGIGPAEHLREVGVEVLADLPEVGENLQDHIMLAGIRAQAERPLPPPSGNFAESTVFLKTDPAQEEPELQLVQIQVDYAMPWQGALENSFSVGVGHMRPRSRGTLRLASADPEAPPLIDPGYLSDPYDMEQLIRGVEEADRLFSSGAFDEWGIARNTAAEMLALDRPLLERAIGDAVSSFFHLSGTVRMGSDEGSAVDEKLRVRGVEGLRVADASVMPRVVSCNTNAATMVIAEKAADLVLGRDPLHS